MRFDEIEVFVAVLEAGSFIAGILKRGIGGFELRPRVLELGMTYINALDRWDVAPEAAAAAAAFRAVQGDISAALRSCASGRELIDMGYPGDVDVAAELDGSASVPVLDDGMFVAG